MKIRTALFASILLAVVLSFTSVPAPASSLSSEIDWISTLPGVTLLTSKTTDERYEMVYTITGDGVSTLQTLRTNLQKRGWKIKAAGDIVAAGSSVRSFVAYKRSMSLKVSLQQTIAISTLALVLTGNPRDLQASVKVTTPSTVTTPQVTVVATPEEVESGADVVDSASEIVVNNNDLNRIYRCSNAKAVINGDDNRLTFQGTCSHIVVNGNNNQLTLRSLTPEVVINGNHNTVKWSAAKNPTPPEFVDNGSGNRIVRLP